MSKHSSNEQAQDDFKIKQRKITGNPDYNESSHGPPATVAEFLKAVDSMLSLPGVHAVRWRQYTPYYRDGDPCEFGVQEPEFRFTPLDDDTDERGDYEDGFMDSFTVGWLVKSKELELPAELSLDTIKEAAGNFEKLNLEHVCKVNFGDHATVTATLDGFNIESYEHE